MSSPTPEFESSLVAKKSKSKDKQKKKKTSQTTGSTPAAAKNEGVDPNWDYKPPAGAERLYYEEEDADFDWETLKNNDDIEIWAIRVPDTLKLKYLDGVELDAPSSSASSKIGHVVRKSVVHNIYSIADGENDLVGGEELRNISCLLPRIKKRGKLYSAPKPVARHLVISAAPTQPQADQNTATIAQNPPRPSYPKEALKHRFVPYGSINNDGAVVVSDDKIAGSGEIEKGKKPVVDNAIKPPKSKKRKVESETPKKAKKVKTTS